MIRYSAQIAANGQRYRCALRASREVPCKMFKTERVLRRIPVEECAQYGKTAIPTQSRPVARYPSPISIRTPRPGRHYASAPTCPDYGKCSKLGWRSFEQYGTPPFPRGRESALVNPKVPGSQTLRLAKRAEKQAPMRRCLGQEGRTFGIKNRLRPNRPK
jgi:hypothetical protein